MLFLKILYCMSLFIALTSAVKMARVWPVSHCMLLLLRVLLLLHLHLHHIASNGC